MRTTETICKNCGIKFQKRNADYNRTEREGKNHFCSLNCSCSYGNRVSPRGNIKNFGHKRRGRWRDDYSSFRFFIRQVKKRKRDSKRKIFQNFDVDLEFLKDLWDKQNGICPYTGYKMELPPVMYKNHNSIYCASLDRIDPSKGYLQGNVEFVCQGANLAKNRYSREETLDFFKNIRIT